MHNQASYSWYDQQCIKVIFLVLKNTLKPAKSFNPFRKLGQVIYTPQQVNAVPFLVVY